MEKDLRSAYGSREANALLWGRVVWTQMGGYNPRHAWMQLTARVVSGGSWERVEACSVFSCMATGRACWVFLVDGMIHKQTWNLCDVYSVPSSMKCIGMNSCFQNKHYSRKGYHWFPIWSNVVYFIYSNMLWEGLSVQVCQGSMVQKWSGSGNPALQTLSLHLAHMPPSPLWSSFLGAS